MFMQNNVLNAKNSLHCCNGFGFFFAHWFAAMFQQMNQPKKNEDPKHRPRWRKKKPECKE